MLDKGDVIRSIGFHNWDTFEVFMLDRPFEWDEYVEEQVYHPQDVSDFKEQHGIK